MNIGQSIYMEQIYENTCIRVNNQTYATYMHKKMYKPGLYHTYTKPPKRSCLWGHYFR
jgi:hypothetical protein